MKKHTKKTSGKMKYYKSTSKSRNYNNRKKNKTRKTRKTRKTSKTSKKYGNNGRRKAQHGGFSDCSLATVKEPAFNIPALNDIQGLSIPETRGVIYRPDCQKDTNQAMIP